LTNKESNQNNVYISHIVITSVNRDSCKLILANTLVEDPESTSFILDVDYFLSKPRTVMSDDALIWVENAHGIAETIFEGCLTQPLRDIFQEVR